MLCEFASSRIDDGTSFKKDKQIEDHATFAINSQ